MKTQLLLAGLISLLLLSCVKGKLTGNPQEPTTDNKVLIELMTTTKQYQVPIKAGYITTVSHNGMLLARTSTPLTIQIPKSATTKGGEVDVTFAEGTAAQSFSNLWQTIIFEDSKGGGDYDYNDIVLHVNYQITGNTLKVKVHPIALGSTKQIKVGYMWKQNDTEGEVSIAENSRTELFGGELGFINSWNYDVKYPSFVNETSVSLPNATDAVSMAWFIEVDKNEAGESLRLLSINQTGRQCLDDQGYPYGIVLTNVGDAGEIKSSNDLTTKKDDSSDWEDDIDFDDIDDWAFMPKQPAVPAKAKDITTEDKPWDARADSYVVKAGVKFGEPMGFKRKDQTIYVQGTLTIKNTNDTYNIVVLPSGTLIIPDGTTIQNVTIHNYGTLECGATLHLGNKAELKTNQSFIFPDMNLQLDKSLFYVDGAVSVANLEVVANTENVYMKSLTATQKIHLTNNTETYVDGSITANEMELNSDSETYVDCAVRVAGKLYLTNNAELSVRSYISAQTIETTSSCELNIKSGALIETQAFKVTNVSSSSINVIGSEMGVIVANKFEFGGGNNLGKYFRGNIGIVTSVDIKGLPNNVTINSGEISAPKNECSPGYNNNTNPTDNGHVWFAYPQEGTNIGECYDFEAWQKGDFNFTKLPTAKVFNIFDTNPRKGEKVEVYRIIE